MFDVILVVKDLQNMQSKIVSSTQHYGNAPCMIHLISASMSLFEISSPFTKLEDPLTLYSICPIPCHAGLQISRFFFCSSDNFTQSLKSTNVKLFLSTHTTDVCCALQEGIVCEWHSSNTHAFDTSISLTKDTFNSTGLTITWLFLINCVYFPLLYFTYLTLRRCSSCTAVSPIWIPSRGG